MDHMSHGSSTMMDMSHAASTMMDMAMGTATAVGAAATASAKPAMDMGGMGMGGGCKISMLWNWNVIDTCFISSTWRIRSKGMFAGSCIGVILLVMTLELLRRSSKEYDRYIIRQHQARFQVTPIIASTGGKTASSDGEEGAQIAPLSSSAASSPFRPSLLQQAIRATLHMAQFAVAYFVMLLAMYYNGYFIICIIIGAWLGAFVFSWQTLDNGDSGPKEDATYCCG